MNQKLTAISFAAAIALAIAGSFAPASAQSAAPAAQSTAAAHPTLTLTDKDNGLSIFVKPGTIVEIKLPQNMSTGYAWQLEPIEGDGAQFASEADRDFASMPGTEGEHTVILRVGQSGSAEITLDKMRAHSKPVDTFVVSLKVGPVPATQQEAAKMFAEDYMHLQCDTNHEPNGKVDHVWLQGQFVLADWSCGHMRGEMAFQLQGMAHMSKSVGIEGSDVYDLRLPVDKLTWLGMDAASAQKLLGQRDKQSN